MARQFYIPGLGVVNVAEDGREWYLAGFGVLNEADAVAATFQPLMFVIT